MISKHTNSTLLPLDFDDAYAEPANRPSRATNGRRANDLTGKDWTRNSISVWSDIKKDAEETELAHPAIYPKALVSRVLETFTRQEERIVLDPFSGSGSTLLAAYKMGKVGIGFEINPESWQRAQLYLANGDKVEPSLLPDEQPKQLRKVAKFGTGGEGA